MAFEGRVGELFVLGFRGLKIPSWLKEFESRFGLGGVILFDYNVQTKKYENNVESPTQLRALCAEIHSLPSRPVVLVDQEGGKVRRLKEKLGFAPLPSAKAFAGLPREERRALADRSFRELRSLGVHMNLAPVADLDLNPENPDIGKVERSFSPDPRVVREACSDQVAAAREAGIGLCLKHFPGLGGARVNSHEALTDISGLVPNEQIRLFQELGEKVPAVLVSHGLMREWESGVPISTSRVGVGKLRALLPHAILLSDDLQMQGLQKLMTSGDAAVCALDAGIDWILVGNNLMAEDEACLSWADCILRLMDRAPVFRERVKDSLARVARAKQLLMQGRFLP